MAGSLDRLLIPALRWLRRGALASALGLIMGSVFFPGQIPAPQVTPTSDRPPRPTPVVAPAGTTDYSTIWRRSLQENLIEKPAEVKQAPPPAPPPPVELPRLLATFVEGRDSWGLFIDKAGSRRVRGVGECVDGFTIQAITPGATRLESDGKTHEIRIPDARPAGRTNHPRRG